VNLARIILIVVALAFAGVTVFLVRNYLVQQETKVTEAKDEPARVVSVEVLVAERELPAGTILNPDAFRWQTWPQQGVNEAYIVRRPGQDPMLELTGAAVKRVISSGDPVTRAKLVLPGESGFLAGVLAPGMRAISIPISAASATSGFILPGNLVDLMLTQQSTATLESGLSKTSTITETILEGLRILAIDQSVDDSGRAPRLGRTATVEVTPKQAEIITVAGRMGRLSLVLRSLTDGDAAGTSTRRKPFTEATEVSRYLNQDESVRERYMVAARDLQPGTLLQDLDFKWALLEEGAPRTGLLLRSQTPVLPIRGSYLKSAVKTGQPITDDLVIKPQEQGFIVAALQPGMRAVSFPISQVEGVGGYIAPGDHVDILMTHSASSRDDQTLNPRKFTETVFKDIRLLGLEQTINKTTGRPEIGGTATVEVTPRQAEELMLAIDMGSLTLAMRSVPSIDLPPEADRLPYTTDLSISDALVNLLVFGTRTEPELVRARQASLGAGVGISTPQRRIIRPAPSAPESSTPAPAPSGTAPSASDRPPGLSTELPAAPVRPGGDAAPPPLPLPSAEPAQIRIYRGTGMSTVTVK
jgi:pilus assembly protein CpaB